MIGNDKIYPLTDTTSLADAGVNCGDLCSNGAQGLVSQRLNSLPFHEGNPLQCRYCGLASDVFTAGAQTQVSRSAHCSLTATLANEGGQGNAIVMYITFLALPLLGIALMAFNGKSWIFLGIIVSPFVTPNPVVKSVLKSIHEILGNAGYFFIAFHAAAALFHHYVQKDNTLLRMIPGSKKTI